ncbi:histidinol dehydrogenase [Desulfobacterota bacterium AH_259_B03_O07]|nr:histidinol dehydrogenase [Desulfobacterota bacterium AH_259_B03_O07]
MRIVRLNKEKLEKSVRGFRNRDIEKDPRVELSVRKVVNSVIKQGDRAVFSYTKKYDNFEITRDTLKVSTHEFNNAKRSISNELNSYLAIAAKRIRAYQRKKLPKEKTFTDSFGNKLGWLVRPIEKVGIYVPGGKASYPSTVLMTAIPAKIAGVEHIAMVTPSPNGEINPAVLVAATIAGVDSIYKIGGAQAIAALAYGTESIPKVDKIVGPGNIYVTLAKKLVYGEVDIDSIAGPTEVLIISDGSIPSDWVAADLLAQAEHDEMSIPILVTNSIHFARRVINSLSVRLKKLKRMKIAKEAVKRQGRIFVVDDLHDAARVANLIAPEHLEIFIKNPRRLLNKIKHAGAIFLGPLSTEAFGDYVAGPSHVLPTGGTARFSSPLSVNDFLKMPSVISISKTGFKKLRKPVVGLANSEGLQAHALSVEVRVDN